MSRPQTAEDPQPRAPLCSFKTRGGLFVPAMAEVIDISDDDGAPMLKASKHGDDPAPRGGDDDDLTDLIVQLADVDARHVVGRCGCCCRAESALAPADRADGEIAVELLASLVRHILETCAPPQLSIDADAPRVCDAAEWRGAPARGALGKHAARAAPRRRLGARDRRTLLPPLRNAWARA